MDHVDELMDSASRLFSRDLTTQVRASSAAGEWPHKLWAGVEDMGFPIAMVRESSGGVGLAPSAAFELMRVVGRHALPLPLSESMVAAWLLDGAGLPVPAGPLSLAQLGPSDTAEMRRDGSQHRLTGRVHRVPWGRHAVGVVVFADSPEGLFLVSVDPARTEQVRGLNLANEPRDTLSFRDLPVVQVAPASLSRDQIRYVLAVARSVQIAGACEAAFELVRDYANLRVQFGQPIAKFQAVQHALATAATQVAAASAAASIGIESVASGATLLPAATAKIRTGEAGTAVAAIAHQVFGAIGFTREHSLHHFTKRLWAWRDECGDESHWAALIGRSMFAAGADRLWPSLTS